MGEMVDQQTVWTRYTEKGKEPVVMKLKGDPFEVCNAVRARMFPGVRIEEEQLTRGRKWKRESSS